ncbi:MAG: hypothetical protein V4441_03705 [Pseudomonadota bacterium]
MTRSNKPMKSATTGFKRFALLAVLAGLALSACSNSGEQRHRDAEGKIIPTARDLDPAATRYSDTMDAVKQGDCSERTVTMLTCYAYRGHGYEGAQTALGQCYMKQKNEKNGLTWLKRAADSGWPEAQTALANHYLDSTNDPAEGGKWAILYRRNPSLLSLGVAPDERVAEKMGAKLNDTQLADAQARAKGWVAKFWKPETALDNQTAATCYVAPRREFKMPELNLGPDTTE